MRHDEVDCLAVLGLVGWHIDGRGHQDETSSTTYSKGPYDSPPPGVLAIDMSEVYRTSDNAVGLIWKRPSLSLSLPDDNVRNLFEGCIGNEGTTKGHPWDGQLESLHSTDSVGLNVYVAILLSQGGKMVYPSASEYHGEV